MWRSTPARWASLGLAFALMTPSAIFAQSGPTPASPDTNGSPPEPPRDDPPPVRPETEVRQGNEGKPPGNAPTETAPETTAPPQSEATRAQPFAPDTASSPDAPTPLAPTGDASTSAEGTQPSPTVPAAGRATPQTTSSAPTTAAGNPPPITTPASPTRSWPLPASNDPTQDQRANDDAETKTVGARVRWRGTAFVWSHNVTTSTLGVGSDFQSTSHQVYTQGYALTLNYYVVDSEALRIRVAVTPGIDLELTDSGETATRRETVVRDLPFSAVAITPLYKKKGSLYATSALGNFTAIVPTSKFTRGQGDILTLSPRLLLLQSLPLAGKGATFLESVLLGGGVRYDAQFTEANVGVSDDVDSIPRQTTTRRTPDGSLSSTDVLSGARVAPHTFRFSGFAMIQDEILSIPFNVAAGANYTTARIASNGDSRIELPTGETEVASGGRRTRPSAGWSAGLTVFPITELGVSLGYSNTADLGGETPNVFYTPSATFSAALAVSIDAIYEGLTGPRREIPFILF